MREIECTPMTHCNNVYGVCDKGWYSNAFWALRDFIIFCYEMSWFRDDHEMSFVRFCCCLLHNFLMRFLDDILRLGQCHFRTRFCFEILYVLCSTVLLYDFLSWFRLFDLKVSVWDLCFLIVMRFPYEATSFWVVMRFLMTSFFVLLDNYLMRFDVFFLPLWNFLLVSCRCEMSLWSLSRLAA